MPASSQLAVGVAVVNLAVASSCSDDSDSVSGVAITEPTVALSTNDGTAEDSDSDSAPPPTASTKEQPTTTQAIPTTASTTDHPTTTSVPPGWSGAVRDRSDVVQQMAAEGGMWTWHDPLDAPEGWIDVERVVFSPEVSAHWYIELAAKPPRTTDLDPELLIAYGLVLDATGDGAADYLIGIDNDAPQASGFRVWVTDLATGETDEQIGPPYGYPIEFAHPDDQRPGDPPGPPTMVFTFLYGSSPADLDPETVRCYAWTSATRTARSTPTTTPRTQVGSQATRLDDPGSSRPMTTSR